MYDKLDFVLLTIVAVWDLDATLIEMTSQYQTALFVFATHIVISI